MENIQIFKYNETPMEFEVINGQVFANATIMCQAFSKTPYAFLRLESTNRYIDALRGKNVVEYIVTKNGGSNSGTWIHEKLILRLSAWLNVDFEVWCDERIAELLKNGRVEIKSMSIEEIMIQQLQSIIEAKKELAEVKYHQTLQDSKIELLEAKTTTRPDVFTVAGYASLNKLKAGLKICVKVGVKASRICKERGYVIDKCEDPRFGAVNMYPRNVLVEVFSSLAI